VAPSSQVDEEHSATEKTDEAGEKLSMQKEEEERGQRTEETAAEVQSAEGVNDDGSETGSPVSEPTAAIEAPQPPAVVASAAIEASSAAVTTAATPTESPKAATAASPAIATEETAFNTAVRAAQQAMHRILSLNKLRRTITAPAGNYEDRMRDVRRQLNQMWYPPQNNWFADNDDGQVR